MRRHLVALALALLTAAGALSAAVPAQAVVSPAPPPASTVCTAGACVAVVRPGASSAYTATVTCTVAQTVSARVRGYFADGNYTTSGSKSVACRPGTSTTVRFVYLGSGSLVGFRAASGGGPFPPLGNYVGTPVPAGGREIFRPVHGFSWD